MKQKSILFWAIFTLAFPLESIKAEKCNFTRITENNISIDVVNTARILLDYDPDENRVQYAPIHPNHFQIGLQYYPNPAQNAFTIEFSNYHEEIPVNIEIYNMLGELVKSVNTQLKSAIIINTKGLKNGLYYFRVNSEKQELGYGKIVISR